MEYLDVFKMIEGVSPYHGIYDPSRVAISVVISILAAFVALSICSRMAAANNWPVRLAWAAAGACAMGGGIWAMHFVGMLAFALPCGIAYDPIVTLASMVPGILASGVALYVIGRVNNPGLGRLTIGAVLMGAGIGAMHYSGMAAIRSEAIMRYRPDLFALSVVVAVVLAFVALEVKRLLDRYRFSEAVATAVAAVVMGSAVAGMHYTAMQASVFFPGNGIVEETFLPAPLIVVIVTSIAVLVAGLVFVATIAGRQTELVKESQVEIELRRSLEQEAQSHRAKLQAILDAVVDAIITTDREGRIRQWSSGAERIFGYKADEVAGKDLAILMPEPFRSRHAGYMSRFVTTGQAKVIGAGRELAALHKDGTEFPIELAISEVKIGDEVMFTGILRDITERKRANAELVRAREQAEAANLAKSQFLATMSHEIRTPMNGVLGMAGLLSSTPLNERQQRLVENISRSGQALLGIINDILDVAKIEAGKFELSSVPFDSHEAAAELADLFAERCAKKGIEFIYFVAEDVPSRLVGDPARLRQVLVNLVGNAVKFTERGEILVEISAAKKEADGVLLNFAVEDSGIGIPPEQCARVFESFHQVDSSMTRARGGSGLGLSITRQLVELMGGNICVESELGRGSRFSFTARFGTAETEADLGPRHLPRSLRVLLVDSNPVSAHVISLYLSSWHVDATIVSSIDEAEAAYRRAADARPFDVAVLDVKGLGERAVDFAKAIRRESGAHRTELIFLVCIDGYAADSGIEALAPAAVLPKPARASELFNALVMASSDSGQTSQKLLRSKAKADLPKFGARVLVAEDNPVNQEVATGILEMLGCTVVTAPNGRSAFRQFTEEKFDLVLMDCEMPIMNGMEATKRIRQHELMVQALPDHQPGERIPIIALTAHALNDVREQCLAAGMDDFLSKPFDERQLAATLSGWLKAQGTVKPASSSAPGQDRASAEPEIVDPQALEGLRALDRKGGPSRLGRAVSRFIESAPPLVTTIRESCDKGDAEAMWRAAHSLKSSAGTLGARRLAKSCAEIESFGRKLGVVDDAKPLVATLDADLDAAVRGLQALVEESHEAA